MSYAIMPLQDWQNILSSVKAKTGKSEALVSAQVPGEIDSITSGGGGGDNPGTGGGSAEFNIAYGDTAPEDTSKLWIKTNEPNKIHIGYSLPSQGIATIADGASSRSGGQITTLTTALPYPMTGMASACVGTKVYLFGGRGDSSAYYNTILCFDTITQSIKTLSQKLPKALSSMKAGTVGTKVYLFGGTGSVTTDKYDNIYCFDTETETLETLSTKLWYPASSMAVGAVGTKIYLFGGREDSVHDRIYYFDTTSQYVGLLTATLPAVGYSMNSATVGTKIYVFGGMTGVNNNTSNAIYCFDTETETIKTLTATLSKGKNGVASATVGTKVYLFGGGSGSTRYNEIFCLDTETETFEALSETLPYVMMSSSAECVGTKIYLFGGLATSRYADIHCFELAIALENGTLAIIQNSSGSTFPLINTDTLTMEIGVDKIYKGNAENVGEQVEAAIYQDGEWTNI